MPRYRPNVAVILRNSAGEILICERADCDGCWQFPQGGVKKGETLLEALHREVKEELGLKPSAYRIVSQKGPYRYLFMKGKKKEGFDGQEQTYFLADLLDDGAKLRFDHEFQDSRWIAPEIYQLAWVAEMKKEVYTQVFSDFFTITFSQESPSAEAQVVKEAK